MAFSIEIREGYLNIAIGEQNGDKLKISKTIFKKMDDIYIRDGYIINKLDFTLFMSKIIEEYGLKNKDCYLNINASSVIRKEIELPQVKKDKLEKLITNAVEELFNNSDNFVIDYTIIKEILKDGNKFYSVAVYAMPKRMLQQYNEVLKNIQVIPKGLEITTIAIMKILDKKINNNKVNEGIILFVGININSMDLNLIFNGASSYKKTIDITDDIRREKIFLANKTKTEENFLDEVAISKENENLKSNDQDRRSFLDDEVQFIENTAFISPVLIKIDEEIHKIMQFIMSIDNTKNIDRVYLYGNIENIEEIAEYISNNITGNIEKIKEIENIKISKEIEIEKYFIAIANTLRK